MSGNKNTIDNEKNWLIKSSTRILGPYTHAEVAEMIKKKHLSLLDEVRRPLVRWMTLRENKTFVEAVKYLQEMDAALEGTTSQRTMTASVSRTENIYEIDDDDSIESTQVEYNRSTTLKPQFNSNSIADSAIKDITPVKETNLQRHQSSTEGKSFGAYNDQRRIENFEKKYKTLRKLILGVSALVILGFAGQFYFQKEKSDQQFNSYIAAALRYKSLNLYDKSIDSYKKARAIKKVDALTSSRLAPIAVLYESDISSQRQVLLQQTQSDDSKNRKQVIENLVSIGLSYSREFDLEHAKEYFQKAISYDPNYEPAVLNKALTLMRQNQQEEALTAIQKFSGPKNFPALWLYAKGSALVAISKSRSVHDEIKSLTIDIENQLRNSSFLQNHLRLLDIQLQMVLSDKATIEKSLEKYLQLEPGFSSDLVKNYQFDWKDFESESYQKKCDAISSQLAPGLMLDVFNAFCAIETDHLNEAQKSINNALAAGPTNPYALHVQSFYLWKLQKMTEVMSLFKKNQVDVFPTTQSLLGRICIELKDESCADQKLNSAKASPSSQSQAFLGLATWLYKNGKGTEALSMIRAGLDFNSEYRPLLELRSLIEAVE